MHHFRACCIVVFLASAVYGIQIEVSSTDSLENAVRILAEGTMSYYSGDKPGGTPGLFPYPPYYWWESGSAFGELVDYYYYTGDPQWNKKTVAATTWQAGTTGQFMPSNQSFDMGNDDQAFWSFTAMNAAETNFPPPTQGYPSWADMCAIVFNLQVSRWDTTTCNGGLRWQVYPTSDGYNYKNVAANGAFFMLGARLARYSNNETYATWAEKTWDWLMQSPIIDSSQAAWRVYDGTDSASGCKKPVETQWTYNYGLLFGGLAYLYNHTKDDKWLTPLYGVLNGTFDVFFKDNQVLSEVACEEVNTCQTQPNWTIFKSFTLRWLATTAQLVPGMAETIWPYIQASAVGAAGQCDGNSGSTCGYHWTTTTWDGTSGLGQQMSALAAVGAPLAQLKNLAPPLTVKTGAKSHVSANGTFGGRGEETTATMKITTGDRAGAGILTVLVLFGIVAGSWWLVK